MRVSTTILFSIALGVAVGCGDDDRTPSDAGPGGGGDAGPVVTGCADGTATCPTGQVCCSGVPYPTEGVCGPDCPAVSDRAAKESVEPVDPEEILQTLSTLPISEWSYRAEGTEVRHVGPMAQDFHAAFGLGDSDRHIHPVDANGVVIAAVQALERRVSALEDANASLRRDNAALRQARRHSPAWCE